MTVPGATCVPAGVVCANTRWWGTSGFANGWGFAPSDAAASIARAWTRDFPTRLGTMTVGPGAGALAIRTWTVAPGTAGDPAPGSWANTRPGGLRFVVTRSASIASPLTASAAVAWPIVIPKTL